MKTINLLLSLLLIAFIGTSCGSSGTDEKGEEKKAESVETTADEGWTILFDGTSTDNFRGYGKEEFPEAGWEITENGELRCIGSGKGEAGGQGGDIITKEKYSNFELSLEWKISEGGNSGIFYLGQELEGKPIYMSAPEMQILDNEKHPDAKLGKDGNRKAGALYDLIPAVPQNAKPAGEWNSVKILVYDGTVVHTQNGENVVEYHLWTDKWKEMCANSKFADWPEFVDPASEGYIGLQDHGNDVWFRNIKVKEL
ncbi:MAG: DUF1080 domain-containing protein [Bacteroidales bacterium]|nr:DUF1080 domain-containing protein [Bacteroidales bacterium]